jgi:hypothetical protein
MAPPPEVSPGADEVGVVLVVELVVGVVVVVLLLVDPPLLLPPHPTASTSIVAPPSSAIVVFVSHFISFVFPLVVGQLIPRTLLCETRAQLGEP